MTLKQELISTNDKLNKSKKENADLQAKNRVERQQLREKYKQKIAALQTKYQGEIYAAKAKNAEYEAKLHRIANTGDIITVKQTSEEELQEIKELRDTVLRFDKENQNLTKENDKLKKTINIQQKQIDDMQRERTNEIANQNRSQPVEVQREKRPNREYMEQINKLQRQILRLQEQIDISNAQQSQNEQFEQKYLDIKAELAKVQRENTELQSSMEKMKAKAKFSKQTQAQESKDQTEKIKQMQQKLEESNNTIKSLQKENKKLTKQSKKNISKLAQLELHNSKLSVGKERHSSPSKSIVAEDISTTSILGKNKKTNSRQYETEADESSDYKKALRLIGKMWLMQQNEPK